MNDRTNLGDDMKKLEHDHRRVLDRTSKYVIVRVDGRAFHTHLRHALKPFDPKITEAMQETARTLCKEVQGTVLAYTQSDEISLLIRDFRDGETQPWMGGVEAKILSLTAARASVAFTKFQVSPPTTHLYADHDADSLPVFDSRLFVVRDTNTVRRYFTWRFNDAVRNSISMAAQANFSHRSLQGVKSGEMRRRLREERGIEWDNYPAASRFGTWVTYVRKPSIISYVDKRDGETRTTEVDRGFWELHPIGHLPPVLITLPEPPDE